tara:strand:- start:481 stop:759 length:279 start_codon:yes stop_codon:yes gene_type:complete
MKREEILDDAKSKIQGERRDDYGDAWENHSHIASMWSVLLDTEITVAQVYQCMIAVKLSRLKHSPEHLDSWVDIVGYAALGGEAYDFSKREK